MWPNKKFNNKDFRMNYRPEIDGLRAMAIVPVVVFHANPNWLGGGFIGVDIFFVISGYLITTIICQDLSSGSFNLLAFYERRARRILPALYFMTLACIPFGWFWMAPSQFQELSKAAAHSAFFSSNIFFWQNSGYFTAITQESPLIHTWSLSVEEQFYVFFPLLLIIIWRFKKTHMLPILSGLALISLLCSEWAWRDNHPMANFYLLPTRAWELLAGALTAVYLNKYSSKPNSMMAFFGVTAILFSFVIFDKSTPFPSVYALLPVLGTVTFLLYGGKETIVGRALGTPPVVAIGLISYSTYLWHQPLFTFLNIKLNSEPSSLSLIVCACLSFVLGSFSFKFVEQPFRKRSQDKISQKTVFVSSGLLAVFFVIFYAFVKQNDGFSKEHATQNKHEFLLPDLRIDTPIYVIGDSHAAYFALALPDVTQEKVTVISGSGCIPFLDVDRYDSRSGPEICSDLMTRNLETISALEERATVILTSLGPVYLDGTTFRRRDKAIVTGQVLSLVSDHSITSHHAIYEIGMRKTLSKLSQNKNLDVIFAIDVPELGIDGGCWKPEFSKKEIHVMGYVMSDFRETLAPLDCFNSRAMYDERVKTYKSIVYQTAADFPEVYLFDPTKYFCDEKKCFGYLPPYGFLYSDMHHLSKTGSRYLIANLIEELKSLRPSILK